jgi:hypothetical protein
MNGPPEGQAESRRKLLVNLGSGPKGAAWLPAMFADWEQLRVDIDPDAAPDVLADITDLTAIPSGSADAVWSAHCIEHLYLHEVGRAIAEAHRILANDGFLCLIVPDLQSIASYIVNDRLHEVIYQSPAGPVTAHDMLFGFGLALARGRDSMAHNCGFTPSLLMQKLQEEGRFAEIVLRRRSNHELAAVASKRAPADAAEREALLAALEL